MTHKQAEHKFDQVLAVLSERGRMSRVTGPERGAVIFGAEGNMAFLSVVDNGANGFGLSCTLDRIPEPVPPGAAAPDQPPELDVTDTPVDQLVSRIEAHLDPSTALFAELQSLLSAALGKVGLQLTALAGGTLYLRFDTSLAPSDFTDFNQLSQQVLAMLRETNNPKLPLLIRSISIAD